MGKNLLCVGGSAKCFPSFVISILGGIANFPILQVKKLRLGEIIIAQGHTTLKGQNKDLKSYASEPLAYASTLKFDCFSNGVLA